MNYKDEWYERAHNKICVTCNHAEGEHFEKEFQGGKCFGYIRNVNGLEPCPCKAFKKPNDKIQS